MASEPVRISEPIKFGNDFELDVRAYELRRSGKALKLERIPMELLVLLVEQRGQLVTRDQIVERIWGKDVFLDTDNSINAAIRKIRQVLKDDPERPRFVLTVIGKGYRFVAPVEKASSAPPPVVAPTPALSAENLLGKRISHYRIIQVLGGGGMGVVYKAEDLKLGRHVALKLLPSELASDPIAFERLQREARAASALDHPNICSVYQLGEHEGQPFMVMQLLEGQTLREWIETAATGDLTTQIGKLLELAIQITEGLEAAHAKGIIHRDIKPANIFITSRGQAKILDFGVAKFVETGKLQDGKRIPEGGGDESGATTITDPRLTRTGASIGTPSYLSPEQIRHEELDPRTDLFSFGLVLYEMATGHRAFAGNSATLIQDAVLHLPILPASQLQPRIPPELEAIIQKSVEKDRNLRYQTADAIRTELQGLGRKLEVRQRVALGIAELDGDSIPHVPGVDSKETRAARSKPRSAAIRWWFPAIALALVIAGVLVGVRYLRTRRAAMLTAKDTIVLGDFGNSTGDPIFDDTLKQALTVTLRQSPFLNILPESKITKTLKLMTRQPTTPLTPAIASEVCQRVGSKAYVAGAIGTLGSEYVLGLRAVNCHTGDTLAQEQVTAAVKERVLSALGDAARKLRSELGESLSTVEKFDVPLVEATTSSLEALQAFSQGSKIWLERGETAALPFLKRAVELDPKFAHAYVALGTVYNNLEQSGLAMESFSKAYELRDRASERERFYILGHYYGGVTGELDKAAPVYEQWKRSYPSDSAPRTNLGNINLFLGHYEDGLAEHREALRAEPNGVVIYENLALTYIDLNRFDEAKAVIQDALARHLEDVGLHAMLFEIAVWRGDKVTVQQQVSWAMGKAGVEDAFLAYQAEMEASFGHVKQAREFSRRAVDSAIRSGSKETAAYWQVQGAEHEADVGNLKEASEQAEAALSLAGSRDIQILAAVALARAKKDNRAKAIADRLNRNSPLNTIVQRYWIPSIHAVIELNHANPPGVLEALQPAVPYELGSPLPQATLYPVYLRGKAFLQSHQGTEAAAEFHKILSHAQLTTFVTGAIANLELGRAYAMSGDVVGAKTAYQDFLNLWRDADRDIPLLKQAKGEYAKLAWATTEVEQ